MKNFEIKSLTANEIAQVSGGAGVSASTRSQVATSYNLGFDQKLSGLIKARGDATKTPR